MNRMELLSLGLKIAYEEESWYPPLKPLLDGLTAEQALWKPVEGNANCIWENVNHLIYYKERFYAQLKGADDFPELSGNDDTFHYIEMIDSNEVWAKVVERHEEIHQKIVAFIERSSDEDFDRLVPKYPLGTLLYSILTHDAYHSGQIVQLRKMQGSWPERRSFE